MKRIIYTRPDGGVSIIVPSSFAQLEEETENEFLQRVRDKDVPVDALDIQTVDEIPSDRSFRNAWRQSGGIISVDMPAAREIHAERLAEAQVAEGIRLKIEERKEQLKGNVVKADSHTATLVALDTLDLNTLSTQIGAAPNPTVLAAIWPLQIPR